jgi:hypothetical protein
VLSGALLNVGAVLGLWGVVWFLWDKLSPAPMYLLGASLASLAVGSYLS